MAGPAGPEVSFAVAPRRGRASVGISRRPRAPERRSAPRAQWRGNWRSLLRGRVGRAGSLGSGYLRAAGKGSPLLLIVVAHLSFLIQGAMLGCGFEATAANQVDDNQDAPNSYTCSCRCSASPTLNVRVSAALDDVEGPQGSAPDGAT